MVAFPAERQHRLVVGAAALAAAFCVALLLIGQLHLVRSNLLTGILAILVGSCAALIFWRERSLVRSVERQRIQRAIINSSPNAVVISDSQGHVVALNPAAERMFGREATAIERLLISDLMAAPEASDPSADHNHANILDRLGQKIIVDGRRPDGTTFPAEISILRVGQGGHTMFAAYIRDLTEQRRADADHEAQQERIHQTEKLSAMGSLLAGVAHELNNPLAILVTQATLLREKAPTPDVERRAERIHAAAQRAGRIVKSFLAMARQKPPVRVPTDLNSIIEAAVELVAYGLRSAGIQVELNLAGDLPPVAADRDLMGQVFANVLINAQQALADRPEPRIRIVTYREADTVVSEIGDNGPGIPDDVRERMFEPYFTTKPVGAGTGIGLSVCRNVVTAHGGTIDDLPAESGTVIRIVIPLAAPAAPRARPAGEKALSVLVVDDELDVAESLAELMDILGHRTVVMSSPMDALDRLRKQEFDAVFTDLRMPGMSGLSLRQQIRAIDPGLAGRTVIMTGDTVMGPQSAPEAVDGGLTLEKPFTAENVRALLEQVRAR